MEIKDRYVLGPNHIEYSIIKNFPAANKVGVFLSGGMESSLITLIALEVYGPDKVVCFYSDNMFSSADPEGNKHIRTNIERAKVLLGVDPIYIDVDYDKHINDRKNSVRDNIANIKAQFGVDVLMFGFTELFFQVEPFRQHGLTKQDILDLAFSDPVQYKNTIQEFHLETDQYTEHLLTIDIPPEVYSMLKDAEIVLAPFRTLNKAEVVDLYRQMGVLDYAYKTSSCVTGEVTATGRHCGHCFNCQQRYDAYRILGGIKDLTVYASKYIVMRRAKLEKVRANNSK